MVALARNYDQGPVQLGEIAQRENLSVKYLEQLVIPLKKARYIKSTRGPKGGHRLTKKPQEISVGEIVRLLEKEFTLARCIEDPSICDRSEDCVTRGIWAVANKAMCEKLDKITLAQMLQGSTECFD
jgi:Rrf2 family protein